VTDYVRSGMQIVIPAGSTTGSVTLTAVQDTIDETNETIVVSISGVTNATESGIQQDSVTITDDDQTPGFVGLVDDPQNPGQRMLVANGTNADDKIFIQLKHGGREIVVKVNGRIVGVFDSSQVSRVVSYGFGGNDWIHVDHHLGKSAELHGDAGNDHLSGGDGNDELFGGDGMDCLFGKSGDDRLYGEAGDDFLAGEGGNDILLGGTGDDRLHGGPGRDILIGGLGADTLRGKIGDDIMIGGTTTHDANKPALTAILAEWTSGNDYVTRVNNIRSGLGQSNGFRLTAGVTVIDDGLVDELFGGVGLDWFFNSGAANDRIRHQRSGERVN
jgi:Ca2+-binding RTX toxin-like protein